MILFKNRLLVLVVCLFIQSTNVVQAKVWLTELLVKADIYSYILYFGVDSLGTDGFDAGLDVTCPPPGPTFYSYFWIDTLPYYLSTDIRASTDDSITWILKIVNATGLIDTITWNPYDLPNEGNLILADTIDMKSYDKAVYAGNQTLTIKYISSIQGYEHLDASQSNIFAIDQGYPNPMHSGTTIHYQLIMDSFVSLKIYDITGVLIATLVNQLQSAGLHTVYWYGKDSTNRNANNGIYFYQFMVRPTRSKETLTQTNKLILLR